MMMKLIFLITSLLSASVSIADSRFHGTPVFAASAKEVTRLGDSYEQNSFIRDRANTYCIRMFGENSKSTYATVGYVSEPRIINLSILGEENDHIVSRRLRGALEFDEITCD
ncbi:MAG: hypothetical protein KA715_05095 [Xanthomonadaceae bacterium]|nr:hypothetical protein [Xanthomonadaceae bacterium]